MKFRPLRADEIELRVGVAKESGVSLLLYKDARCDMNILDETVGAENWQRSHVVINDNLFCNLSIKTDSGEWVSKQDVGTESNTEKEKGEASDSFKRAAFNWGIGRELYTAPFIWIKSGDCNISKGNNGKPACFDKSSITDMTIDNGKITALKINNDTLQRNVYSYTQKNAIAQNSSGNQQKASSPILCERCRGEIRATTGKKGETISALQVLDVSLKRFGRAYCSICQKKLLEEQKEENKNA